MVWLDNLVRSGAPRPAKLGVERSDTGALISENGVEAAGGFFELCLQARVSCR
jgi:hypothetical protein